MADQAKWFKLWVSALADDDLENLSIEEWFRWVRLGAYIKCHGTNGSLRITAPARTLQNVLRVPSFEAILDTIKVLPNCELKMCKSVTIKDRHIGQSFIVTFLNWHKYQVDSSKDRMRNLRAKKDQNVTVKEEKRGEETKVSSPSPKSSPSDSAKSLAAFGGPPALATQIENDPGNGAGNGPESFFALGQRNSSYPQTDYEWQHLERTLEQTERVQSQWREKFYVGKTEVIR